MTTPKIEAQFLIKRAHSRYIMIDENIHEALNGSALKLYMAFRFFADFSEEDAVIKRSVQKLHEKAKISRRQFFISINILEEFGLVKRCEADGYHSVLSYHVARELNFFNTQCLGVQGVHEVVQKPHTDHYPLSINNITTKNSSNIIKQLSNTEPEKVELLTQKDLLADNPHAIEPAMIAEWMQNRKKKKGAITRTVWNRINRVLAQLNAKGIHPFEAFERMVTSNWLSIETTWFKQEIEQINKTGTQREEIDVHSMGWLNDDDLKGIKHGLY